jgi:hypothetical protein
VKKKAIIVVLILLAFGSGYVGLVLFSNGGEYSIQIDPRLTGLTSNDVVEIKRAVRKELRQNIFREFSWTSFKALPGSLWRYPKMKILKIEPYITFGTYATSTVMVTTGSAKSAITNVSQRTVCFLSQGSNGWGPITFSR